MTGGPLDGSSFIFHCGQLEQWATMLSSTLPNGTPYKVLNTINCLNVKGSIKGLALSFTLAPFGPTFGPLFVCVRAMLGNACRFGIGITAPSVRKDNQARPSAKRSAPFPFFNRNRLFVPVIMIILLRTPSLRSSRSSEY